MKIFIKILVVILSVVYKAILPPPQGARISPPPLSTSWGAVICAPSPYHSKGAEILPLPPVSKGAEI